MRADRPSSTATLIAAATVFLARDPREAPLVPAGAAAWCARFLEAAPPSFLKLLARPGLAWAARLAERATVPGLLAHFMRRKRWIEQAVRAALAAGCARVVVLGAGFDTLCLRLAAEHPRTQFVEIDHPATQRCKRAVAGEGFPNLRFVAADLAGGRIGEDLTDAVVVLEGLLMYLSAAEIETLFGDLRAARRVVFTVMEGPTFANATPLVAWLLARWREPFKSSLARAQAAGFVRRFGFELQDELATAQGELVLAAGRA